MGAELINRSGMELGEIKINPTEPSVILVFGKVGVGKTSLAQEIASRLKTSALSSDEFRRRRYFDNQYQEWHSSIAMEDMIVKARQLFYAKTSSVVLDATLSKWKSREKVRALARKFDKKLIWVEVLCREDLVREGNIDGNLIARQVNETTDVGPHIVIDNSMRTSSVDEQMRNFVDLIIGR